MTEDNKELLDKNLNDCYICTDPTDGHSPCECQIPVHMKCLLEWIEKNDNNRLVCSVCNKPFYGIELPEKKSTVTCNVTSRRYRTGGAEEKCLIMLVLVLRICYYLGLGYLGKYLFAFSVEPGLINDKDYWSPFDFMFFLCATCGYMISTLLYNLRLKIVKYLRRGDTEYYEEFSGSDSDNIDSDDSVV